MTTLPELTVPAPQAPLPPQPFRFTGSGGEYFRIWIVNMLLTVLTLGIYSAWAKVRRLQYFYQHTEVAGSRFDYHGSPLSILKGRLIALALLLAYQFSIDISVLAYFVTLAALLGLLPWLLRNSFRVRLRNSSYRNLRFSFRGGNQEAYKVFLAWPLLSFVTANLLAPVVHQRLKRYQHGQAWFGHTPFSFHATEGQFYRIYGLIFALALGAVVLIGGFAASGVIDFPSSFGGKPNPAQVAVISGLVVAVMLAFTLLLGPLFTAMIANLVWNGTRLGEHRFESRLHPVGLMWIGLGNFALVLLTLGLYMPWAMVRLARYRADHLSLLPARDVDGFLAEQTQDIGAIGEETAEMFDFDIGL
jgi:uncharacterized membrane protein YjgN (DUF898 family)